MNKSISAYKTISEVVKILGLKSRKGQSIPTHTIRYWEKEFKQIRPKIFKGNRRYYDDQGMTINGVKKILNSKKSIKLDEISNHSIKATNLKNKLIKISEKIKILKKLK